MQQSEAEHTEARERVEQLQRNAYRRKVKDGGKTVCKPERLQIKTMQYVQIIHNLLRSGNTETLRANQISASAATITWVR